MTAPTESQTSTLDSAELEMTEVASQGLNPKAILAIGALGLALVAFVLFGLATGGGVGLPKILIAVIGLGASYFAGKQIAGATSGELKSFKDRLAKLRTKNKQRAPSVCVRNSLLDI